MKQSNTCPKCNSHEIIRIPGSVGAYGSGNNIMTGMTTFSAVEVTRYVCGNCGFSEEWIDNAEGLAKVKKKFKKNPPD